MPNLAAEALLSNSGFQNLGHQQHGLRGSANIPVSGPFILPSYRSDFIDKQYSSGICVFKNFPLHFENNHIQVAFLLLVSFKY